MNKFWAKRIAADRLPPFPDNFRFGVATADHQCEAFDGKQDIRDRWESIRGLVARGEATDFWNRYAEDINLAKSLGCRAFRLSLSWARLEPAPGQFQDDVFEHYRAVLKQIRDADMLAVVTLHHNTWPLHVQAAGGDAGLLDSDFPKRFATYTRAVALRLGDLIDYYVTINEPNQLVYGFIKGWWMRTYPMPPGLRPFATYTDQMSAVVQLIPNLFRAHKQARDAIKSVNDRAMVGSNPLILGLPRWLQHFIDWRAKRARSPAAIVASQAKVFSQRQTPFEGKVDFSIAQLTITQSRMEQVLFSEGYYIAHFSALHHIDLPIAFAEFTGRVGVTRQTTPAYRVQLYMPKATVDQFASPSEAVTALKQGDVDLVFDDDVVLKGFVNGEWHLTQVDDASQVFAVALPLGDRALLNAVDIALREFKQRDNDNPSRWDDVLNGAGIEHGAPPTVDNRKTIPSSTQSVQTPRAPNEVPDLDGSLARVRKRDKLRVGIRSGVQGLCFIDGNGDYAGLEPALARYIASRILPDGADKVEFVELNGQARLEATTSWFQRQIDPMLKTWSMLATIVATNWWSLGMAGELPDFLCPVECVGQLDYVGLDYYWGVKNILSRDRWQHLMAAMECHYAHAPVWPNVLYDILLEHRQQFPAKPIIVIENGCVTTADSVAQPDYISRHIEQVQRAVAAGVPVSAYLCWSITSNREWGLPFDGNSDFGLYHIDLDDDRALTRRPTDGSRRYAAIISARTVK